MFWHNNNHFQPLIFIISIITAAPIAHTFRLFDTHRKKTTLVNCENGPLSFLKRCGPKTLPVQANFIHTPKP